MRERRKWGKGRKAIEPTLELLEDSELALSRRAIYLNLNRINEGTYGENTVRRAVNALEDEELVEVVDENGAYVIITDAGRKYLESEKTSQ
jgi:Fe2+ or Zn2+ uptake regulation protein